MAYTTKDLAKYVDFLADMDAGLHWCPDLAGVIDSSPPGALDERTVGYARDLDLEANPPEILNPHPWTVDSIVRHAVIPYADTWVSDGMPVDIKLGRLLVDLVDSDQLSPETVDALDELLVRLWDILIDPDLIRRAIAEEKIPWARLQRDALRSVEWRP